MSMESEERKRQAFAMSVRGISEAEIAMIMGLNVSTVRGYLTEFAEEAKTAISAIQNEDYVAIAMSRFRALREETWSMYRTSHTPSDKARAMKLMLQINKDEASFLSDRGMLHVEPKQYDHKHSLGGGPSVFMSAEFNVAALDAMTFDVLSQRMGVPAEELMDMMPTDKNYHSLPPITADTLSLIPTEVNEPTPELQPLTDEAGELDLSDFSGRTSEIIDAEDIDHE